MVHVVYKKIHLDPCNLTLNNYIPTIFNQFQCRLPSNSIKYTKKIAWIPSLSFLAKTILRVHWHRNGNIGLRKNTEGSSYSRPSMNTAWNCIADPIEFWAIAYEWIDEEET